MLVCIDWWDISWSVMFNVKFIPFKHRKVHFLQNTPSVCVHDHVDIKSVSAEYDITGTPNRYIAFPDHIMNLLENNLEKLLLLFCLLWILSLAVLWILGYEKLLPYWSSLRNTLKNFKNQPNKKHSNQPKKEKSEYICTYLPPLPSIRQEFVRMIWNRCNELKGKHKMKVHFQCTEKWALLCSVCVEIKLPVSIQP